MASIKASFEVACNLSLCICSAVTKTKLDIASASQLLRVDEAWLARQFQCFGGAPGNVRIGNGQAKGYDLADFTQAFASFLDGSASQ